ncbi:glycosyltransferase [Aquimarina sp. 2201CG14-23]|uniref:glycosyltransferase n=1 Tax=Aquimarina mycalae TaxID=3040073 RepID=UPI002478260D|nr:glycosyltransferase [Aquimarina sp. 2201CG14-23]MDH7446377.1 glycosyltransferase [Aquimarina sp. 2201CG14-23]
MSSEVIVLIPHYENVLGLINSIKSIQENFLVDIIIVDDGSKNKPLPIDEIQKSYNNQGNIIFEIIEENKGIEVALNVGLSIILEMKYKYIARLDCGDLFHKDKLRKQLTYLKKNKDVKLLGTWGNIKDQENNLLYIEKHPVSYEEIKKKIYLNSTFLHPSVVFEVDILSVVGLYPLDYQAAEDYGFFMKIVKHFRSENYPETLIDYIIDPNSISSLKRKRQVKSRIKGIINNYYIGWYPTYGLLRNVLLLFLSRKMSNALKSKFKR